MDLKSLQWAICWNGYLLHWHFGNDRFIGQVSSIEDYPYVSLSFPGGAAARNLPVQEMQVWSLAWEDPLK